MCTGGLFGNTVLDFRFVRVKVTVQVRFRAPEVAVPPRAATGL